MSWFRKAVKRKRYLGYGTGAGKQSTHSPKFRAAYHAFAQGRGPEPAHVEMEVVTIKTISGPRLVWADRVDEYKEVLK